MPKKIKTDQEILDAIIDIIDVIFDNTHAQSVIEFEADINLLDATAHRLNGIGNECGDLSPEIKDRYPDIDWENAVKMRHIMAHEYARKDPLILWAVIQNNLLPLRKACSDELERQKSRERDRER